MFQINKNPSRRDVRWFAAGMLVGFPLLSCLLIYLWRTRSGADRPLSATMLTFVIGLSAIGVSAGMSAIVSPRLGRRLYVLWMTFTVPIGMVMSTLLLTVLYFVFLPVFSLIVRRHDPLRRKMGASTYWEDYKPHEATLDRMRRPF